MRGSAIVRPGGCVVPLAARYFLGGYRLIGEMAHRKLEIMQDDVTGVFCVKETVFEECMGISFLRRVAGIEHPSRSAGIQGCIDDHSSLSPSLTFLYNQHENE